MPRLNSKKCAKKKLDFKQKRLLKARLIRISMVIDDYVYKGKVISTSDAQMYIEEVSKYKPQFGDDARSLQVIEKITRCMNAAISEQQEENDNIINLQSSSKNNCPSPVYSLPEEDKTMLSQESLNHRANMEPEINKKHEFETVDLCSDDDATILRNVRVHVEIHRAMSNLSITENSKTEDSNTIKDYSQSILEDFNVNRADEIRKAALENRPPFIERNKPTAAENIDCSQSILTDLNPNAAKLLNFNILKEKSLIAPSIKAIKKNINVENVQFKDNIQTKDISKKNKANTKKPRQYRNKAVKVNNCEFKKNSIGNQDKACKQKKKNTKVSPGPIITASTDKGTRDSSFNTITNDIIKLPSHNINTTESINQKIQSTNICGIDKVGNSICSKSMAKIYNANIENDLSWIENIQYVREICTDEFDPSHSSLANTFWENFALPSDWNEKDFDYIT